MEEQRTRARSSDLSERFAAALVLPGLLRKRLRVLSDRQLGQVLDHEVCSNLSVLAPELTVCMEAADRLLRRPAIMPISRRRSRAMLKEGEHIMHAEAALYRERIPHLLLPFQRDRFASNAFVVPSMAQARDCLCKAGFREARRSPLVLIDRHTNRPIRIVEQSYRRRSR